MLSACSEEYAVEKAGEQAAARGFDLDRKSLTSAQLSADAELGAL